ncbi:MAG TPA: ribosome silencing factor [Vicinamibacterales bacterium]|nr:ribosome silencing factor [Vicinamibacterales bacterium]
MKSTPKRPRKRASKTGSSAKTGLSAELTAGIAAALDKKAEETVVLDLTKASAFTDFFVICTGTNRRQVQAIADGVQEAIARTGARPALVEGYERGDWILIDYFDFIFHIFMPATREFYGLEKLWGDAEKIPVA